MSTALSQPQRSWWSLPQKSPIGEEAFEKNSKNSGKFNTLASAIGLRPKKSQPPALTLREEAVHVVPRRPYTAPSPAGIGRPPSNSVSSSRSRVDSLEPSTPRTPEDARRGSLMTLSDDPFAAARIVSVHSTSDPNRLSAFSNSSELRDGKYPVDGFQRVSYASASSSSKSFRYGSELSPLSPISDHPNMMLTDRKSSNRKDPSADNNRFSQPDPPPNPRPPMRARGMTDGGLDRVPFLRSDSITRATSPRSPVSPARKLSQRTAPPTSQLPSPPRSPDVGGLSVDTTGFIFPEVKPLSPRKPKLSPESSWDSEAQPRVHRTLKKSMSQQSLSKQRSPAGSTVPLPDPSPTSGPRKQRSFHRLPVHAVPLQLPLSQQRAEPPQPGRKRLFSTSSGRRPSQSTLPLVDDARSISESDRITLSATTSCWIDTDQPRTPTSAAHEYTPQQIMSPAEMLEVEASVDAEYSRPRGGSIMSASTSDFDHEYSLSPSSSFGGGRKRSNSGHPSLRSDSMSPHDEYYPSLAPEPPSPPILMSLPPPPRRTKSSTSSVSSRTRPEHRSTISSRSQPDILAPLSPPPRRNIRPKTSTDKRQSLLRKPSFLDIDDDVDKEPLPPPPPLVISKQDSFLDLTRESFDSSRSDDSF
ncbi:hypothetical protein C8F01DRAFT_1108040 [Mycena amicta]|nr:hypothetical protein C8F01DRAFT_1108040 [Mycena amicta]